MKRAKTSAASVTYRKNKKNIAKEHLKTIDTFTFPNHMKKDTEKMPRNFGVLSLDTDQTPDEAKIKFDVAHFEQFYATILGCPWYLGSMDYNPNK